SFFFSCTRAAYCAPQPSAIFARRAASSVSRAASAAEFLSNVARSRNASRGEPRGESGTRAMGGAIVGGFRAAVHGNAATFPRRFTCARSPRDARLARLRLGARKLVAECLSREDHETTVRPIGIAGGDTAQVVTPARIPELELQRAEIEP